MVMKYYIASLTFNGEEIQRVIGRRDETAEELRHSILSALGLTMREIVVDAPIEMIAPENKEMN